MPSLINETQIEIQAKDKMKSKNDSLIFKKGFPEQIFYVLFSPYDWSQDILCVVFSHKIQINQVKLEGDIEFKVIGEFHHVVHCSGIDISPLTSLVVVPKILQFSTAGNDFKIRVYKSDLVDENTCQVLDGHTDYINDLSYDCESNFLASVSDDHTARIWDTSTDTCISTFNLQSPGMTVCWHVEDCAKLMVGEKKGIIRYYNVQSQQPILSVDNGSTLSSAHWNPNDSQLVGALTRGQLKLWDLTRPSRAAQTKVIYVEDGGNMRFNQEGNLVSIVSPLSFNMKVFQLQNNQLKLNAPVLLPTNVTWHFRLPVVCIGDDRHLCFWKIEPN